jgi:threonine dehydratase
MSISKKTIAEAAERIRYYIHRTPVLSSSLINEITGAEIHFKCENFQKAGAFKGRGAHNVLFSLNDSEIINGVITHSSGNHAGALALAAKTRGTKAYIIMPETAPSVKVAAVKAYGGEITFCKPTLEARESTLKEVQKIYHPVEVHPYNDERIIAGQATAAKELFEIHPDLDILLAPVGGGGLLSGTALSANYFSSSTEVIAAEPKGADDAWRSFTSGKFVPSENPQTIADGLLTSLGSITFPIIKDLVSDILTVEEETIIRAMKIIWERMKIVVEPSSAVPLAAILENPSRFRGKKTGIILSGGNVDLNKLPWNKE